MNDESSSILKLYLERKEKNSHDPLPSLSNTDFSLQDLTGIDMSGADLRGSNFNRAKLTNARLCNAILDRANLEHADLSDADLSDVRAIGSCFNYANLSRCKLNGGDFDRSKFEYVIGEHSHFNKCDLTDCNLSFANFQHANFSDACLKAAKFINANLAHSVFDRANLNKTQLNNACIYNISLLGAYGYANITKETMSKLVKLARQVVEDPNCLQKRSIDLLICDLDRTAHNFVPLLGTLTTACFALPIRELTSLLDRPEELLKYLESVYHQNCKG